MSVVRFKKLSLDVEPENRHSKRIDFTPLSILYGKGDKRKSTMMMDGGSNKRIRQEVSGTDSEPSEVELSSSSDTSEDTSDEDNNLIIGSNSSTTTTTTTTLQTTPSRKPNKNRAGVKKPKKKKKKKKKPKEKKKKEYPISGKINTTTITSLLYKRLSGKDFCWKLHDYEKRKKAIFTNLTRILYFPGGNIFEDNALDYVDDYIGSLDDHDGVIIRQKTPGRETTPEEADTLNRLGKRQWKHAVRDTGLDSQFSDDLTLWGRRVSCKADGYTNEHVVEVKAPFGHLYKVYKSGTKETVGDDGNVIVSYNEDEEIFSVPPQYMCQLLIEMNVFKKRKAYFGQYYSFKYWYTFMRELVEQYKDCQAQVPFVEGQVLHRSRVDLTIPIKTLMNRCIQVFRTPSEVKKDQTKNLKVARDIWYTFLYRYTGVAPIPDNLEKEDEKEDFIERNWRPQLHNILKYITSDALNDFDKFNFTPFHINEILRTLTEGKGGDIQRGVVKILRSTNGREKKVQWDGEDVLKPLPSFEVYAKGIKRLASILIGRIHRKDKNVWDTFESGLKRRVTDTRPFILDPNVFPNNLRNYDEFVLVEVDLSDNAKWEEAMKHLNRFLRDCEKTTEEIVKCRGRDKITMTGKGSYREDFIKYLESIPVIQLPQARQKIPF